MRSHEILIPGTPVPKSRPRMVRGRIWTPSDKAEDAVATAMLRHKGKFSSSTGLLFSAWFYGAHGKSDLDNLVKLQLDAAVKAGVISNDNIGVVVRLSAEARKVDDEFSPFGGLPGVQIRIGEWHEPNGG